MPIPYSRSASSKMKAIASSLSRIGRSSTHNSSWIGDSGGWRTIARMVEVARTISTTSSSSRGIHGPGPSEKSVEILKSDVENPSKDRSVLKGMATAFKQNRSETDFVVRGSTGEVPSGGEDCVGPVEIRRSFSCDGGRGLFATRALKAGELLLVSHPLAVVRKMPPVYLDWSTSRMGVPFTELVWELGKWIRKSKRQMAQLYSLFSFRGGAALEIPSMELFRPGSQWVPEECDKREMQVDDGLIRDIVYFNAMNTTALSHLRGFQNQANERISGVWALPSFANHSCAPNVVKDFIGTALCFRASVDMATGEELTVSYLHEHEVFGGVETRRAKTKGWFFRCECERCRLEESLKEKLSEIWMVFPNCVAAAKLEGRYEQDRRSAIETLAKVAFNVEVMIHSQDPELGPRQQSWIRATFVDAYLAELQLAMDVVGDSDSVSSLLRLVLDSLTSISITPGTLNLAARLLCEVEHQFSRDSDLYSLIHDRVLSIYEVAFGDVPDDVLGEIVPDSSSFED